MLHAVRCARGGYTRRLDIGRVTETGPRAAEHSFALIAGWGNTVQFFRECDRLREKHNMGMSRYIYAGACRTNDVKAPLVRSALQHSIFDRSSSASN